jgi:hypothetical protein
LSHRQVVGGRRRKPQRVIDKSTDFVHFAAKFAQKVVFDPQTKPMNIAGGSADRARFGTAVGAARW